MNLNTANGETSRYRHITSKYCVGCGVDVGSQGEVVVPWGISYDLPEKEFFRYSAGNPPKGPIHLRGFCDRLPFDSNSLDWLYSSHLLEDFVNWDPILEEWVRVIKPGGNLIILVPDRDLWQYALYNLGQLPNDAHTHESHVGELSSYAQELGLEVVEDRLTKAHPNDYTIIFVGKKK